MVRTPPFNSARTRNCPERRPPPSPPTECLHPTSPVHFRHRASDALPSLVTSPATPGPPRFHPQARRPCKSFPVHSPTLSPPTPAPDAEDSPPIPSTSPSRRLTTASVIGQEKSRPHLAARRCPGGDHQDAEHPEAPDASPCAGRRPERRGQRLFHSGAT